MMFGCAETLNHSPWALALRGPLSSSSNVMHVGGILVSRSSFYGKVLFIFGV